MATIEGITLALGEKEYTVRPPGFKKSRAWRKRFSQELQPMIGQVGDITTADWKNPSDLLSLWPIAETVLMDGLDAVFELLIMFSAVLEDDREYIENEATDRQIWEAFTEVVKLIDPFGISRVLGKKIGRMQMTTGSNLQLANGALPSSGPNDLQSSNLSDSSEPTTAGSNSNPG